MLPVTVHPRTYQLVLMQQQCASTVKQCNAQLCSQCCQLQQDNCVQDATAITRF
jgi:hypothetical protein